MSGLAAFTEFLFVWTFTLARKLGWRQLNSTPFFKAIRNPLGVRIVQNWLAYRVACLTALMVYPCIISFALVHANSDSDSHAWPSLRLAFFVAAAKPAHDIGVVCSNAINILIEIVESEMKVFNFKQARHIIVH
jgi:hypothetical protein